MEKENQQEFLIKLSMFEQQARQIEGQVQQVDEQVQGLEVLSINLSELKQGKGKEILAPIGKGIFVRSELKEDKFILGIGSGVFVKKNAEQARAIVEKQVLKLKNLRTELITEISKINEQLDNIINSAQKS